MKWQVGAALCLLLVSIGDGRQGGAAFAAAFGNDLTQMELAGGMAQPGSPLENAA